jgi:hypothetical protein
MNGRARADGVEIAATGGVLTGVALGDDQDGLALPERLDELNGAFAADGQRQDGVGKEDCISNWENRERAPIRRTGGGLVGLFSATWADDTDKVVWH